MTDLSSKWSHGGYNGQYFVQKDHILYGIDNTDSINTYDMRLRSEHVSFATNPSEAGGEACLAIVSDTLFVIGGFDGDYLDTVGMLDLITTSWVPYYDHINTRLQEVGLLLSRTVHLPVRCYRTCNI